MVDRERRQLLMATCLSGIAAVGGSSLLGSRGTGASPVTSDQSQQLATCAPIQKTGSKSGRLDTGGQAQYQYDLQTIEPCQIILELTAPEGADFDLFVTLDGRTATRDDYDRKANSPGNSEALTIDSAPAAGEIGILVDAYSGEGEYSLTVTEYTTVSARHTDTVASPSDPVAYQFTPDSDPQQIIVSLDGPEDADTDLYLTTDGRRPSPKDYDRLAISEGPDEQITVTDVSSDTTLGILVDTWRGSGEFTLTIAEEG